MFISSALPSRKPTKIILNLSAPQIDNITHANTKRIIHPKSNPESAARLKMLAVTSGADLQPENALPVRQYLPELVQDVSPGTFNTFSGFQKEET